MLDLHDPRLIGVGVQKLGRIVQLLVDLGDHTGHGAHNVGHGLDGFDVAGCFARKHLVAGLRQNQKNRRTLLMFILATLAVIVVIGALFVGNMQQNKRDAIVLPDAAQSTQPELQPDENEPALLEVTRENVQSIVRSLRRPQYYHQTYTITRQMNGAVSETSAELWVADTRVCAVLTTASGEKHILTDGETLYVWYAGDETVRTLAASQDATMDELIGIPTYEQVGAMPPASITDGEFITDDRYDSGQQIFAASEEGTVRRECWISLSYGLLTESILKSGGETIYDAIQTGLEILAAGDETFEDVFTLPDGTVPFQE